MDDSGIPRVLEMGMVCTAATAKAVGEQHSMQQAAWLPVEVRYTDVSGERRTLLVEAPPPSG